MAVINQPPNVAVDSGGQVSPGWATFFSNAFAVLSALTQSGTTAQRPTRVLWIGRTYFDTTLGIPVWYDANGGTGWCDATGAAV